MHSPLALARMENQVLVVLGTDSELMLCGVEDVEQQITLAGAVNRYRQNKRLQNQNMSVHAKTQIRVYRKVFLFTQAQTDVEPRALF